MLRPVIRPALQVVLRGAFVRPERSRPVLNPPSGLTAEYVPVFAPTDVTVTEV
ncbi:hypothetical protein [Billgrantia desiderata]|uniref:hypothetical protein n=1 Tax=Billgrantia desiderata TaxID=52021 RepID=UPI001F1C8590|nr:hypothetical protein [Halomonas desiderata]MCE8012889.1 hypothetical protein [Halomonas desiderata]